MPTSRMFRRPSAGRPSACSLAAVALALALGAASPSPAGAAEADQRTTARGLQDDALALVRSLAAMRTDVAVLAGAPGPQLAQSAPPSPEAQSVANLTVRMSQLENELRRLTGQIEEVVYGINRSNRELERLSKEMEGRFNSIDARLRRVEQLAAAPPAAAPAAAAPAPGGAPAQPANGTAPGAAPGGAPQTLQPPRQQAAIDPDSALPKGGPKERYDFAFSLLRQADYANAERALTAFLQLYPSHELSGNAKYWLGETFFVRQDFNQAAAIFAEGFQQYPTSQKAPEMLLKLGNSLNNMNEREQACRTYALLDRQFPNMPGNIRLLLDRNRQQARCPG
ncbi:MAG: tol-pal system protein YbgF [Alphaproteobacteria bacterium]|nr:tol-pal system protein YbgF [Alphaproteobacteria bacterium]